MMITDLQPGPDLDRLYAERAEGYVWDETRCRVCGWPLGEWLLGTCTPENCSMRPPPSPRADSVAPVSTDNSAALAALIRFVEKYDCGYRLFRVPRGGLTYLRDGPCGCTIYGGDLEYDNPSLELTRYAPTPAHAIVITLMAALPKEGE